MPRRRKNAEGELRKPLLRFERVVYEKASFRVRQDVLQQIAEYVLYVKEMTGDDPTPDELVDRGMQRLFDADRGFRQWLQDKEGQAELVVRAGTVQEIMPPTNTASVSVPFTNGVSDRGREQ